MPKGMQAIGPLSILLKKGSGPPLRPRSSAPSASSPTPFFRDPVGAAFLYTAANWGSASWYLEVYVRSTSAKALARLLDVTIATPVPNSLVTVDAAVIGVLLVPTRVRSDALTLTDGHEYRVQYGIQDGGGGTMVSARLIAI